MAYLLWKKKQQPNNKKKDKQKGVKQIQQFSSLSKEKNLTAVYKNH